MDERYFLVVHCLKDKQCYPMRLTSPPNIKERPLGIVQFDGYCFKHNVGIDKVSPHRHKPPHNSESVLVKVSAIGDMERLKEIAIREAEPAFGIKGKERVV